MASFTQTTKRKRARRQKKAGRARKRKQAQRSTLSAGELFAGMGEPGQPAPRAKNRRLACSDVGGATPQFLIRSGLAP